MSEITLAHHFPLAAWKKQRTFPHALLLTGAPLSIQTHEVQQWLKYILCSQSPACDTCASCRWLAQGSHPDVLWLPESGESLIKIEAVRHATVHMQQSAHQGGYKIVVLAPAEAMTAVSQHALLKTLEEPPAQSLFILLSQYPGLLLATLRSRCQRWNLSSFASPEVNAPTAALPQTLQALQAGKVDAFQAAAQWQSKASLLDILDECYRFLAQQAVGQAQAHRLQTAVFATWDVVNALRQQVLQKANLNALLVLEYVFQRVAEK